MHIIKGHPREENGTIGLRRALYVEVTENGFIDAETGAVLQAAQYKICDGIIGIEITSPTAAWAYLPDEGQCERIGMPVTPL